jgi:1-acyl-sn-glycerol-3-phosphate acyltransferase
MSGHFRWGLFWLTNILLLAGGTIPLVCTAFLAPRYARNFAVFWARALLKVSGFRVQVSGQENIPRCPVVIAANHTSFFDILLTLGYLPVNFNFVMKEELFKIPVFGRAVKTLGYFPISRRNARSAARSVQELVSFIRGGGNILIYPEGTRNRSSAILLPFKSGMSKLAQRAQALILPVAINCAAARQKLWRQGRLLTLIINKPLVPPISADRGEMLELTAAVRNSLAAALQNS